ncbi:putative 2-(R)-hydroxypropyl-CoM dehydrogenase [Delitschia confertaspora ATCC 74209]|uniref:2-(R)-hydroxypropyl-CoM dehydrogenase n=1 Tax=Delitschia confertaspora ATCC 74209 TaxID=1513339 RepID=A0A9P4MZ57_9PLEO|nr:putative 2-(R)-hydroxypropyl-CoM dehydrogenase [Delitschia confertaspora ATCC 74209]
MPPSRDQPNILRGPGDYDVTTRIHNDSYPEINPRQFNLSGKAVFITGGSRGLGRSMVLSFVKAGVSKIAVGARSNLDGLEKEIKANCANPPEFLPIKLDVTDEASVAAAAAEVEKNFGKLNVLINNAGVLGKYGLIADSDPDVWWQTLNVNVRGPYLVTRAFLPLLLKAGTDEEKYIVNVCSVGAHLTNPRLSAYQVAKNGLLKFTTLTNAEYSPQGVTAFAIHPGNIPTDIMGGPSAIPPHHKHVFVETPELSGDSVVYLVSKRREWLGGRYINCTWDLPELMSKEVEIVREDKLKNKFDYELGVEAECN